MKFFSDIKLLLLGVWLGSACFFIAVAQTVFAVLPTRELAGLVVNRTLAVLNFSGLGIAGLLIVMSLIGSGRANKLLLWIERLLLFLVAAACAVGQFVIGFWLVSIKAQMGRPIDEVAADDPLRLQFDTLHMYSEWVLLISMAAALITFFIIANRKFSSAKSGSTDVYDFSKDFKV